MKHCSHRHPLVLKKAMEIPTLASGSCKCNGCLEPVSGPFYSCQEEGCDYDLHKVCAELPIEMNHPMHPEHTLTLRLEDVFGCQLCGKLHYEPQFVYRCEICYENSQGYLTRRFDVDAICASGSHTIQDKCHMHPLIPMQIPICFLCSICGKEEKGVSYKCGTCSFLVHQDCTVFLPDSVECGDHEHELTLSPSIPYEVIQTVKWDFKCNICYANVNTYETVYSCVGCLFFSHARCAISGGEDDEDDDVKTKHLPVMTKDWTTLISSMVEIDFPKQISDPDELIDNGIDHFSHDHVHDGQWNDNVCGKVCEACAEPILGPSYGCTLCDYFLHKCCIGLPKQISHPFHPKHGPIKLFAPDPNIVDALFLCRSCYQLCTTYGYKCDECDFVIDVKCASLCGRIKHEAHNKHTLSSNILSEIRCSACDEDDNPGRKCEKCSFKLCLRCTALPRIVKHRYCKCQGLRLQYSPLKNYNTDYFCDLCERRFLPQRWYYHCGACDTFAHTLCLIENAGDSNIKFGKRYNLRDVHKEHELILTRFTYEYSNCKICFSSLNKDFAVGFECATCPYFKIHLLCVPEEEVEVEED